MNAFVCLQAFLRNRNSLGRPWRSIRSAFLAGTCFSMPKKLAKPQIGFYANQSLRQVGNPRAEGLAALELVLEHAERSAARREDYGVSGAG